MGEEQPAILVIGGGIAGIQAALDVASQGFTVYLVERKPSIGGHMAMLDKTFPTLDCSQCILTPKMVDVARHPNVRLLTYSEVKDVKREENGFLVKVLKKPRYVKEDVCTGCGICAMHCPVEVPSEFNMGLGIRKAIYVPFPQAVPLKYTIDRDHCIRCRLCQNVCAAGAIDFDQQPEELERIVSAAGPMGGHIIRPSDGKIPRRVAFIQCVGSRDKRFGNPYCSRVCCMYAIKNAILLKEHLHEVDVTIFYMDIRTYGKGFEEFYKRAEEEFGIKFVRGRVSEIEEDPETKNLRVIVENTETGEILQEEFDMVVLSVGLVPPKGVKELSKILGVPVDEYGFFVEKDIMTSPMETKAEGIFLAGTALGPKDIPDSVAEASAAAMRAVNYVVRRWKS
ncbi:MAG TPA: CoB--CoM heterodisulfide reductase iron-sulfur subunit A family protein [Candidatus Bathyarchaeota archaeon]|nr:CoB--CoM heterodisulfide reductase iron-sulfur subunit A family protein [Candidatus Bathyarchaeota archaeon]